MKSKIIVSIIAMVCFLSMLAQSSYAQEGEAGGGIKFGIKGGFNTNFLSQDQPHIGFSPGYHGGVFTNYSFSSSLGLQAEVLYLAQGGQFNILYNDYRFGGPSMPFPFRFEDANLTMHNIDIQLLADLKLFPIEGLSLRVGPAFGFNLGSTISSEITSPVDDIFITFSETRDFTGSTPFFQLGAVGGIGVALPAGSVDFLIDIYYRYGITTAVEGHSYINYAGVVSDLTAHSIALSLGLAF